jgi:hypothetical protein
MANRIKTSSAAIFFSALLISFFAAQAVSFASANPINPPLIQVNSPQNNKIYTESEVQLNFTLVPNNWVNFTSATYSLDGQPAKPVNESFTLTGLTSGSHTLTVYGKGTYSYGGQAHGYDSIEAVIYFSVHYSTSWVTFGGTAATVISIVLLITIWKRRPIAAALKGKKAPRFWIGLAGFLFFTCIFFVPGVWLTASDYLYPHYSRGITSAVFYPWGTLIFVSIFMGIGLCLMWSGTKRSSPQKENDKD